MNIRLSIVDDHPMIIQGIRNILSRYAHITLVNAYTNGTELIQKIENEVPDVLLLDIQLPDKTGDELAPILLEKYPALKIIVLTNFDSTLYVTNLIDHGVHGYLLKTADEEELIKAIETVCSGKQFIEGLIQEKMELLSAKPYRTIAKTPKLTSREMEMLPLIVNGCTDSEIARIIFLSLGTVKHYRSNILLKLDVKNTAALVRKALQLGLVDL